MKYAIAFVSVFCLAATVWALGTPTRLTRDIQRAINDTIRADNVASQLGPSYQPVRDQLAEAEYRLEEALEAMPQ